jgi:hypothetical protein
LASAFLFQPAGSKGSTAPIVLSAFDLDTDWKAVAAIHMPAQFISAAQRAIVAPCNKSRLAVRVRSLSVCKMRRIAEKLVECAIQFPAVEITDDDVDHIEVVGDLIHEPTGKFFRARNEIAYLELLAVTEPGQLNICRCLSIIDHPYMPSRLGRAA